jgi:hypothetical protein
METEEIETPKRTPFTVLGRVIGTALGWDQVDTFAMQLTEFQPMRGVALPAADFINFDFESGKAEIYNDAGEVTAAFDLVTVLANVPPAPPES